LRARLAAEKTRPSCAPSRPRRSTSAFAGARTSR